MSKLNYQKGLSPISNKLYTDTNYLTSLSLQRKFEGSTSFYNLSTMACSSYFGLRKNEACCPIFAFCKDISNAFCNLVL